MIFDEEQQEEYLRSIIGFMQLCSKKGINPKITEYGDKITIILEINGSEGSYTTKRIDFAKANKREILNLLTNGSKNNE
jgi:hypothetical protein